MKNCITNLLVFLILSNISIFTSVLAAPDYSYGDGYGNGSGGAPAVTAASPVPTPTDNAQNIPSPNADNGAGTAQTSNQTVVQGDRQCPGSQLMCITATVTGSTVTYELESTGSQKLGWMAIGFGDQMANTPLVIMWLNSDGIIVLSQRQAPAEVMPTPVPSPARVATVQQAQSFLTGSKPKLVFSIELAGAPSKQTHIWAFGGTQPGDSPDSTILQHIDSGPFQLDLTKTLASNAADPATAGTTIIPFKPYEKIIIIHASLCAFGFLVMLPAGVLLARFTRTFNNKWFTGHWIIQGGAGAMVIIIGIILGFLAVHQHGVDIPSKHKTFGKVLLVLYILQCSLGTFIHFVKIPFRFGRPPQNYVHAILGLIIVGLSLYQIRLGYSVEWINATGRPPLSNGVNIIWLVWVILLLLFYAGGLLLLPRQWRQEKFSQKNMEKFDRKVTHWNDYEATAGSRF